MLQAGSRANVSSSTTEPPLQASEGLKNLQSLCSFTPHDALILATGRRQSALGPLHPIVRGRHCVELLVL